MAWRKSVLAATAAWMLSAGAAQAQSSVEVLHWWTAGGEAAALGVLKNNLQQQGVGWNDMPVAGGGGEAAMTALRARVTGNNPPTAVQMLGFDIQDWARQGVLASLNELAAQENWEAVVPQALQEFSRFNGQWIAAPVNVHSTNWVWANREVLQKAGITAPPQNWDDFIKALEAVRAAGFIPLAHGGQPWQDATLFDGVVLATGGVDFYRKSMIEHDPAALGSATMTQVFERMAQLRSFVDDDFSNRDWNLATAMVIQGRAGFQIMGDWAKGEFVAANKVPDQDFLCFRVPGTQGMVSFNSDQFAMFQVGESARNAQTRLASAIMSPEFQSAFNVVKGSVPARTDVPNDAFDACGRKGMADLAEANRNNTLVGSMAHGHAAPAAIKNAFYDVITEHFNGRRTTAEAVQAMVEAADE